MIPSIKTIATRLGTDPETTRIIRGIMDGSYNTKTHPSVKDENGCISMGLATRTSREWHILNAILDGCGMETIEGSDGFDDDDYIEYVNMGDPYHMTIMFDAKNDRWIIGAWGDLVERQSRRFAN